MNDIAFLQAQIGTVTELMKEANEIGDPLGEYQFAARLEELKEELDEANKKLLTK